MDSRKLKSALFDGIVKNNPVFVLVLGMCPTLAMTGKLSQGFAMGVATTVVLIFSNLMISALRKVIPDKMRIPCYIVVVSTFVIMVEMLMKKFLPDLYSMMKTFISLIVVNCIILARAESYASKNSPLYAAADGLSVGLGFTLSLSLISALREFLTTGGLFGATIAGFPQMEAGAANAFGFIALACLMAAFNAVREEIRSKKNEKLVAEARELRHEHMEKLKEIGAPEKVAVKAPVGGVSAAQAAAPENAAAQATAPEKIAAQAAEPAAKGIEPAAQAAEPENTAAQATAPEKIAPSHSLSAEVKE